MHNSIDFCCCCCVQTNSRKIDKNKLSPKTTKKHDNEKKKKKPRFVLTANDFLLTMHMIYGVVYVWKFDVDHCSVLQRNNLFNFHLIDTFDSLYRKIRIARYFEWPNDHGILPHPYTHPTNDEIKFSNRNSKKPITTTTKQTQNILPNEDSAQQCSNSNRSNL